MNNREGLYSELLARVGKKQYSMVEQMLKTGVLPNRDDQGESCLHLAALHGDERMTELLLRYNADPMKKNKEQKTPPEIAAEKKHWDVFRLFCASENAQLNLEMLKAAVKAREVDIVESMLKRGVRPNADGNEESCLHIAVADRDFDRKTKRIITLLLEHDADLKKQNALQQTPIQLASSDAVELIISICHADEKDEMHFGSKLFDAVNANDLALAKKLLAAGAFTNWNHAKKTNGHLLHLAIDHRNTDMIRLLRRFGVDLDLKKEHGKTAVEYAVQQQAWDCVLVLREQMLTASQVYIYLTTDERILSEMVIPDLNALAPDYKEAVCVHMLRLPEQERMLKIEQALDKTKRLGNFFWQQRGFFAFLPDTLFTPSALLPGLEHGVLKILADEFSRLSKKNGIVRNDSPKV